LLDREKLQHADTDATAEKGVSGEMYAAGGRAGNLAGERSDGSRRPGAGVWRLGLPDLAFSEENMLRERDKAARLGGQLDVV
jgi:hypothetical protein